MGQSPQHARTVALVLSLETGLTSPQFHISMDTTFQTLRKAFGGHSPQSHWQAKCHFRQQEQQLESSKVPEGEKHGMTTHGSTLAIQESERQRDKTTQLQTQQHSHDTGTSDSTQLHSSNQIQDNVRDLTNTGTTPGIMPNLPTLENEFPDATSQVHPF